MPDVSKIVMEASELGAIRNNIKTAEIPQFLGIFQKYDQESVSRD